MLNGRSFGWVVVRRKSHVLDVPNWVAKRCRENQATDFGNMIWSHRARLSKAGERLAVQWARQTVVRRAYSKQGVVNDPSAFSHRKTVPYVTQYTLRQSPRPITIIRRTTVYTNLVLLLTGVLRMVSITNPPFTLSPSNKAKGHTLDSRASDWEWMIMRIPHWWTYGELWCEG